jgi:hypothetical protein
MKSEASTVAGHVALSVAVAALIGFCRFLPFMPGGYDRFALTLSFTAQIFGVIGLALVPIGVLWLGHELRRRAKRSAPSIRDKSYGFGLAAWILSSIVAFLIASSAVVELGLSLGLILLPLWACGGVMLFRRVKRLKQADPRNFHAAPIHLVLVPTLVALVQSACVDRAVEFSRQRAIENSAAWIAEIERYNQVHGRYPESLHALHGDYDPGVIGIERFYYEPRGGAYNVFFENPSNRFGTREIVMYNKLDEHFFASHDADRLEWTGAQLQAQPGHYAVHEASSPHWKYFWFD